MSGTDYPQNSYPQQDDRPSQGGYSQQPGYGAPIFPPSAYQPLMNQPPAFEPSLPITPTSYASFWRTPRWRWWPACCGHGRATPSLPCAWCSW